MTNQIEITKVSRLIDIHNEITGNLKNSLELAIEAGKLLTNIKATLQHGEFIPWIEANMPFTDRTARNYMNLYENKDKLKTESVSDLNGAYKLLKPPEKSSNDDLIDLAEYEKIIKELNKFIGDISLDIAKSLYEVKSYYDNGGNGGDLPHSREKVKGYFELLQKAMTYKGKGIYDIQQYAFKESGRDTCKFSTIWNDLLNKMVISDDEAEAFLDRYLPDETRLLTEDEFKFELNRMNVKDRYEKSNNKYVLDYPYLFA